MSIETLTELDDSDLDFGNSLKWFAARSGKNYEFVKVEVDEAAQTLIQISKNKLFNKISQGMIYWPERAELKVFMPDSDGSQASFDSGFDVDCIFNDQGHFYANSRYLVFGSRHKPLNEKMATYQSWALSHIVPLYSTLIMAYGPRFIEMLERDLEEKGNLVLERSKVGVIKSVRID